MIDPIFWHLHKVCKTKFLLQYFEQSVDSGQGTMATVSTGIARSSWSSNGPMNKQEPGHHGYNSSNSTDHLSNGYSRNLRQPPSPPVRQRAR